jgi:nucleotide-binding universal stress UspA family protein
LRAWRAARRAAELFGASLEAVYCDDPSFGLLAAEAPAPADDEGFRRETVAELRRRLGEGARLTVVSGDPARALLRRAQDTRCDLLVLGTHRRGGVARWLLGSTAEAVVHGAECPVLVVPTEMRAPRRVLAPINEEDYARAGLLAAALVARSAKASLKVLTVVTDPIFGANPAKLLRRRIAELPPAVRRDVRPEGEIRETDPVTDILKASRGCDLVVLAAHRKSLLGDFVLGTTVERVLRHSRTPVLAVPSGRR